MPWMSGAGSVNRSTSGLGQAAGSLGEPEGQGRITGRQSGCSAISRAPGARGSSAIENEPLSPASPQPSSILMPQPPSNVPLRPPLAERALCSPRRRQASPTPLPCGSITRPWSERSCVSSLRWSTIVAAALPAGGAISSVWYPPALAPRTKPGTPSTAVSENSPVSRLVQFQSTSLDASWLSPSDVRSGSFARPKSIQRNRPCR
jgi:hypothetical protein